MPRSESILPFLPADRPVPHQRVPPAAAEPSITVERDITYGEVAGVTLLLDIARPPARETPRPAVLLFHGGAWMYGVGGRPAMDEPALALAQAGYVTFNVEYRRTRDPAGAHAWPDPLDDVQRAVRWVRARAGAYGVDPERLGAYGHSAGAQLASMLSVRETRDDTDPTLAGISSRVRCVVALAGHFDLTIPYPQPFDRASLVALLGGTIDEVPAAYHDASPLSWVTPQSASFLILHGGADTMNPPLHAQRMTAALQAAGVGVVAGVFPRDDHFTVARWSIAGSWALTFFAMTLEPNA